MGVQAEETIENVSFTDGKKLLLGTMEACSAVFDSLNSLSIPGAVVSEEDFQAKFDIFIEHHEVFKRKFKTLSSVIESVNDISKIKEDDKVVVEKLRLEKDALLKELTLKRETLKGVIQELRDLVQAMNVTRED
eukprot:Nk52_evm35s221 gene=Nk52_evmTU35s221